MAGVLGRCGVGAQPALGNPHGSQAADPASEGLPLPLALNRHSPEAQLGKRGIRATARFIELR